MNNTSILTDTLDIINNSKCEILNIDVNEIKISVILKNVVSNNVLEELHAKLIK